MANSGHIKILKQGAEAWNKWRDENNEIIPDLFEVDLRRAKLSEANLIKADLRRAKLSGADLSGAVLRRAKLSGADLRKAKLRVADLRKADLRKADLRKADLNTAILIKADLSGAVLYGAYLSGADLSGAILHEAYLREANLRGANLIKADLSGAVLSEAVLISADLSEANLCGAILSEANLNGAMFSKANLSEANLSKAILVETNFNRANLTNSRVYGISAWDLVLDNTTQTGLIITKSGRPVITVDDIEVAQFVYLLLNNEKIRNVIDTIGEKGVLILGRFTEQRKAVLNAIRDKLRELGFVPMMFDFQKPTQRDFTETIKTLAGLSRFIIADITDPKCIPLEMEAIVPDFMVPLVPIIQEPQKPFAMIQDLQQKCEWVFDVIAYDSKERLIGALEREIVQPAKEMADKLLSKRGEKIRMRRLKDDI